MSVMKPIININGATRESHIEARINARRKLMATMEAIQEFKPHGRDYLGDTARYNADLAIYNKRFATLCLLYNELEMEALAIQES